MIVVSDIVALHGVSLQPAGLEYSYRGRQAEALQQHTRYLRRQSLLLDRVSARDGERVEIEQAAARSRPPSAGLRNFRADVRALHEILRRAEQVSAVLQGSVE